MQRHRAAETVTDRRDFSCIGLRLRRKAIIACLQSRGAGFHIAENAVHQTTRFIGIGSSFTIAVHINRQGGVTEFRQRSGLAVLELAGKGGAVPYERCVVTLTGKPPEPSQPEGKRERLARSASNY